MNGMRKLGYLQNCSYGNIIVRGDDESGGHAVGTLVCSSDIHEGLFQSPLSMHHFIENFIADLKMTELVQVPAQEKPSPRPS
jgi:hypothetical protein